ncbi:MAG: hypothetical protein SGJ21_05510 [Alphaproteobacteria bacterium]|nr:hypothetical protein [Alphaproteobacteria bacterium]
MSDPEPHRAASREAWAEDWAPPYVGDPDEDDTPAGFLAVGRYLWGFIVGTFGYPEDIASRVALGERYRAELVWWLGSGRAPDALDALHHGLRHRAAAQAARRYEEGSRLAS